MIDPIAATTSLLGSQYGLQVGTGVAKALLGKNEAGFSGLSTLQSLYGAAGGNTQQNLTEFVKEFVPNNAQLLQNLDAVFALQSLAGTTALPSTAAFVNPYVQALALGDNAGIANNSLISLIS